jgi:NADH:ubiquinone oxidoreductase subunit
MFKNLFTWWEGASLGTTIVSRRTGEEVGRDEAGNVYFRHRKDPKRRWVIYEGSNDSSRVPPGWNALAPRHHRRAARQGASGQTQVRAGPAAQPDRDHGGLSAGRIAGQPGHPAGIDWRL